MNRENSELCLLSATEMVELISSMKISVTNLIEAHFKQIKRSNPSIKAICTLDEERAMLTAKTLDTSLKKGALPGPLCGLPIVIKDLIDVKDLPTTKGCILFKEAIAIKDALIVQRMRKAGAIIIGKSNVPELGAGSHTFNKIFGVTRNPYDLTKSAGGSSGGGAAAVTSGMAALADGSDLGGSIRNPPSFNNIIGLRTSPGRIPQVPANDPWQMLSVLGPMARNVKDAALLLSVIAGPDVQDPLSINEPERSFQKVKLLDTKNIKIAYSKNLNLFPVEIDVSNSIELGLQKLAENGCQIKEDSPDLNGAEETFSILRALSFAQSYSQLMKENPEVLKDTIIWNINKGLLLTGEEIAWAQSIRANLFYKMKEFLENYDALVLPVSQVLPFPVEIEWIKNINGIPMKNYIEWMNSCSFITLTSHPAISLPCGFTNSSLPVGMQIVGKFQKEQELLSLSHTFESIFQVSSKRPPIAIADN